MYKKSFNKTFHSNFFSKVRISEVLKKFKFPFFSAIIKDKKFQDKKITEFCFRFLKFTFHQTIEEFLWCPETRVAVRPFWIALEENKLFWLLSCNNTYNHLAPVLEKQGKKTIFCHSEGSLKVFVAIIESLKMVTF